MEEGLLKSDYGVKFKKKNSHISVLLCSSVTGKGVVAERLEENSMPFMDEETAESRQQGD